MDLSRKMEQGLALQLESMGLCHRGGSDLGFGGEEGPGVVMDFASECVAEAVYRIEAVAFGEPVFEAAWADLKPCPHRSVPSAEKTRAETRVGSLAIVFNPTFAFLGGDPSTVVGEVKKASCSPDGEAGGGIEAQEPHSGFAVREDISA
jgi:hypothetical protein